MSEKYSPRMKWEQMLLSGGYSIGYFTVTVEHETVRVYHSRTHHVAHFTIENSYEGMERLCKERGYNLEYLLKNYVPKSFIPETAEKANNG